MTDARPGGASGARALALLSVSLAAGAGAQALLRSGASTAGGLAIAAGALALAFAAGRAVFPGPPADAGARGASGPSLAPERPRLAALSIASLAFALAVQHVGRAPLASLAAWATAVLAGNAAYPFPRAERSRGPWWREHAVAAALLAVALAARAPDLAGTPGGLYGDEAAFGLRARALLAGERIEPFGLGLEQLPALWTWLQAGAMALLGDGVPGLRAASVLASSLAVPLLYTMLRREVCAAAAAGGALGLALSPWNVHFGRLALNESWVVLCTVGALGALMAALRSRAAAPWVRAGTWLGLCFYAGNKAVLLPPVLLGAGGAAWLALRPAHPGPPPWRPALLLLATASLVFAPQLAHLFAGHWHGVLVSHPQRWLALPAGAGAWAAQLALVGRALLDQPDTSVFTAWPGMRIVGAGEATLLLVGLGVALARPGLPLAALLLGWLGSGLASLLIDRQPVQLHHLVLLAAAPAAFGALALHAAAELSTRVSANAALGRAAALALAASVAAQGAHAYFVAGARRWSYAEITELGLAMRELAPTHHLVLATLPMSWDINSTLLFLAPGVRARDKRVELDPARAWLEPPGRDVAFLVDGRRTDLLARIRARYPDAPVEERRGPPARLRLAVVRVPSGAIDRTEGALPRPER